MVLEADLALQSPQSTATAEVWKMLESGALTLADLQAITAELTKTRTATHDAAHAALSNVEPEPEKRLSFAEANKFLFLKFDLEAARTAAVKSHSRWGLVDAYIKAGIIKDVNQYSALFDKATISENCLNKVSDRVILGEMFFPIFDAGAMIPAELCAVLFGEGAFSNYLHSYGVRTLSELRRIDPKDIHGLYNLQKRSIHQQMKAFEAAYQAASPLAPTVPRIIFTPNRREVSRVKTSAIDEMQALAKGGITFIDPNADFHRFRSQVDDLFCERSGDDGIFDDMSQEDYRAFMAKALADRKIIRQIPDRASTTHYPNYVFENGDAFSISFSPALRTMFMNRNNPTISSYQHGSRMAIS